MLRPSYHALSGPGERALAGSIIGVSHLIGLGLLGKEPDLKRVGVLLPQPLYNSHSYIHLGKVLPV
jgi:hypothetical protein